MVGFPLGVSRMLVPPWRSRPSSGFQLPARATSPVIPSPPGGPDVGDPLKWIDAPNQEAIDAFNAFTCPQDGTPVNVEDDPKKPLVTCEWDPETKISQKYLLSAAMIEGSQLDSAAAQIPQNSVNYVVSLDFDGDGTDAFSKISEALVCPSGTVPPCRQFAVVLDGQDDVGVFGFKT